MPPIPPPNWMGLSIFSVIFCTLPFGIIALLFSFMVSIFLFFLNVCLLSVVFIWFKTIDSPTKVILIIQSDYYPYSNIRKP